MAEYIEREAALEVVNGWRDQLIPTYGKNDEYVICLETVAERLESLHTADIRPVVRGKWTADGNGYHWVYVCSACGWKDGYPFNERHNFCPNCGADMRGGDAEWESTSSTTPE